MIPLLYFILMANACVLTITFIGKAPNWLNLYVAMALSTVSSRDWCNGGNGAGSSSPMSRPPMS